MVPSGPSALLRASAQICLEIKFSPLNTANITVLSLSQHSAEIKIDKYKNMHHHKQIMNNHEITHILKHILGNSHAVFLGIFASDKPPPLNSIQTIVHYCYGSNIDPTGQGGSH